MCPSISNNSVGYCLSMKSPQQFILMCRTIGLYWHPISRFVVASTYTLFVTGAVTNFAPERLLYTRISIRLVLKYILRRILVRFVRCVVDNNQCRQKSITILTQSPAKLVAGATAGSVRRTYCCGCLLEDDFAFVY